MPESEQTSRLSALLDEICLQAKNPQQVATVLDQVLQGLVRPHHRGLFWGDRMLTLDKAAAFRADEKFRLALAKADSSTGANQYASPDGISWRYNTLIWAARTCLTLPGDYVECGVYCGDMTWMVTEMVDLTDAGKLFYLYDTFTGLDPRYSSEADFPESPQFFQIAAKAYNVADLEVRVRERFAAKTYVVIVKGTVTDILHAVAPTKIAFLHIDMNSPAAERGALDILYDRVSTGGIIVFDDYGWTIFGKQKGAADAFAASRDNVILELPTGQGLMIKR